MLCLRTRIRTPCRSPTCWVLLFPFWKSPASFRSPAQSLPQPRNPDQGGREWALLCWDHPAQPSPAQPPQQSQSFLFSGAQGLTPLLPPAEEQTGCKNLMNLRALLPETLKFGLPDRTKSFQVPEGANGLLWNGSLCNDRNSPIILYHFSPVKVFKHG